ncbi:MAG: SagB/ThcOx family dehydrogenase [Tannerellaceae bacterium]|jgi:SagB-type dehydrogenase family enzyme|nr:SagB/ThcOx family dehydrogenase [Tannerellaceae bacterium]
MKTTILLLSMILLSTAAHGQDLQPIKLSAPDKAGGKPLMKALAERKSSREFADGDIKPQDLSTLLWAANGINRPDGKRTAPSAMDRRDVDVYVITPAGAYLYDPADHALNPVAKGDFRNFIASGQDFAATAPVSLLLVSDLTKFSPAPNDGTKITGAIDIGIVSQNISLACASLELATVPRGTMNQAELKKVLNLKDTHLLGLNHPVGLLKK